MAIILLILLCLFALYVFISKPKWFTNIIGSSPGNSSNQYWDTTVKSSGFSLL